MSIRPVDLPEIRAELADCLAKPGMAWFFKDRAASLSRRGIASTAEALQRNETKALLLDDLFFVAEGMYRLAEAAAESLPSYTMAPEDVPSEFGFAFLAPGSHNPPGQLNALSAVEWWNTGNGVRLNFYCDTEVMIDSLTAARKCSPEQESFQRKTMGRLSPMAAEWFIEFVREAPEQADSYREPSGWTPPDDGDEQFIRTIRAMWLLMQQPLAEVSEVEPDRAARKRLRRAGREPASVRVIELRRPKTTGGTGNSDREYHHAWVVRGHWRQQWFPKREVHRPVWIAPHIKGPEGAPLIGGEKVYALKR